jgi:L-asparaginase
MRSDLITLIPTWWTGSREEPTTPVANSKSNETTTWSSRHNQNKEDRAAYVKSSSEANKAPDVPVNSTVHTGRKHLKLFGKKFNVEVPVENYKTRIAYIPLGGTISATGTDHSYTAGKTSGKELLEACQKYRPSKIDVEVSKSPYNIDSKDIKTEDLFKLRDEVQELLKTHDRIVITHGSDTLSLAAFFLGLTLDPELMKDKTIVFSGAMKPANSPQKDGPRNLGHALRLAKTLDVKGVVCVMDGLILGPPYFDKKHTTDVGAFKPVMQPKIGKFKGNEPKIKNPPAAPKHYFDLDGVNTLPVVRDFTQQHFISADLIVDDMERSVAQEDEAKRAKALVYAANGNGAIHSDVEMRIKNLAKGVPLIRATKVGNGEVSRNGAFKDDESGTICAGQLLPEMAALLVQAAMAEAKKHDIDLSIDQVRELFDAYQTPRDAATGGNGTKEEEIGLNNSNSGK